MGASSISLRSLNLKAVFILVGRGSLTLPLVEGCACEDPFTHPVGVCEQPKPELMLSALSHGSSPRVVVFAEIVPLYLSFLTFSLEWLKRSPCPHVRTSELIFAQTGSYLVCDVLTMRF